MTLTDRNILRWKRDKSEAEREELEVELEDEERRSNALQERVGRNQGDFGSSGTITVKEMHWFESKIITPPPPVVGDLLFGIDGQVRKRTSWVDRRLLADG